MYIEGVGNSNLPRQRTSTFGSFFLKNARFLPRTLRWNGFDRRTASIGKGMGGQIVDFGPFFQSQSLETNPYLDHFRSLVVASVALFVSQRFFGDNLDS